MLNILIILVIKQIRLPLRGRPILLITLMITYKPITYESGDMDTGQARQNSPKSDYDSYVQKQLRNAFAVVQCKLLFFIIFIFSSLLRTCNYP